MNTYFSPDRFIEEATKRIYEGLGHKYNVKISVIREDGLSDTGIVPAFVIYNDKEQPYILPAVQAFIEYSNTFGGNFNRFCEDVCKRVEEFDMFTHSQEEIVYES